MPSEERIAIGPQSWLRAGTACGIVLAAIAITTTLNSVDKRLTVFETNSNHANKSLEGIESTLKEMAAKQDGEREAIGELKADVRSLKEWRVLVDMKLGSK